MSVPTIIAGIEPTNNHIRSVKSTLPALMCPRPATNVSNTACTTSEPIIRIIGKLGNMITSAIIPNAPAPTDESVTNTPKIIPIIMM
ncbi:hypothetical protein D3C76_1357060 [compost metagenome]